MKVEYAEIEWNGGRVRIEHAWLGRERRGAPLVVFLHEGLGSLARWKDFPAALCDAAGCRGLVFSRPGYGRSTPRRPAERWAADFLHRQALEVLPRLFAALHVDAEAQPPWLFGHSDGASIALIHAAHPPRRVAGLVVLAPHIDVEPLALASIAKARRTYLTSDMRLRMTTYHDDPDSAFWGWNDAWLSSEFGRWSIEDEIRGIACPVLAIQGRDDEYGTLEQIRRIGRALPQARLLELADCGHAAHRDQRQRVIAATVEFLRGS